MSHSYLFHSGKQLQTGINAQMEKAFVDIKLSVEEE
jgi:hypothetical protein